MEHLIIGIGLVGSALVLLGYGMLSSARMTSDDARYQLINIAGAAGMLISLLAQWNLPSFVVNVAWLVIGIVCLIRIWRKRRAV